MFFLYFIAMSISVKYENDFMGNDNDLKLTLHEIVSYAVERMETATDVKTRRCLFQEYKEWLGTSIDDWVLALPHDWGKTDVNQS